MILAVAVAKSGMIYALARALRITEHPGQLAVGLGQIGEFSFAVTSFGRAVGAIDETLYAAVLTAVVLTIAASTVIVRFTGPAVAAEVSAA